MPGSPPSLHLKSRTAACSRARSIGDNLPADRARQRARQRLVLQKHSILRLSYSRREILRVGRYVHGKEEEEGNPGWDEYSTS